MISCITKQIKGKDHDYSIGVDGVGKSCSILSVEISDEAGNCIVMPYSDAVKVVDQISAMTAEMLSSNGRGK